MAMHNQKANQDFERARARGFWRRVITRLRRQENNLLPFDEVRARLPIRGQHYLGYRQVPVEKIVGSMGRYLDFDRAFLPTQNRTKERWVSIDKAHYAEVQLPPVELYKIGEAYFVRDGNHRVSVARERGQDFVDAYVTEIDIPVFLDASTTLDDLELKKEHAEFLLHTDLASTRPLAQIQTTLAGLYERFMEHILLHRWYLGEQQGREVALAEAAASWYDRVYQPLVQLIHESGLLQDLPGTTEADLYLWIMTFEGYLRHSHQEDRQGDETARMAAVQALVRNYPLPAVKKLVSFTARSDRIDALLLQQERAIFLEETQLNELIPGHKVHITMPGRYGRLSEHIAVHRWYLGEQRQAQVSYAEAVVSWYSQVYQPLVEIITEQDILSVFPERTETDLYLWVIEHQGYLQEFIGGDVPLEQAAEELVERKRPKKK
jgi:hypothetical protein